MIHIKDIERAIRSWEVGRKNYLLSDNDKCAVDHCVFYTLIGSCVGGSRSTLWWMNRALSKIRFEMKAKELRNLLAVELIQ